MVQARTSTIWPLNISNAFLINGSFLKSSLLKGTGASLSFAGAAGGDFVGGAGVADACAGGGAATGAGSGSDSVARCQPAGASAFTNLNWIPGWPSSAVVV